MPISKQHPHHLAPLNLIGDGVHNFIDGLAIAAAYLASFPVGIATSLAVLVHEIPQEIGDFGVLIHSGLSAKKALFYNFLSALIAMVGAVIGLIIGAGSTSFTSLILPFAAGGFIYIAGSDLIPEVHKGCERKGALPNLGALIAGILLMFLLKLLFE